MEAFNSSRESPKLSAKDLFRSTHSGFTANSGVVREYIEAGTLK
jgi:hypothetical protein